jgi:hypothetical protein
MHIIAELNLLLRDRVELPAGLRVATEEFREGWSFARTADAKRLEKKIQTRGWSFIEIPDGSLRCGVGDTSQEAIASALKLALRRIGKHFNAAELEHIELTEYPWFFLARIRVHPCRIQQGTALPELDGAPRKRATPVQRRLPRRAAALYPQFGSALPLLKQMLTSGRIPEARTQ